MEWAPSMMDTHEACTSVLVSQSARMWSCTEVSLHRNCKCKVSFQYPGSQQKRVMEQYNSSLVEKASFRGNRMHKNVGKK
jgi:hypothetical protein